MSSHTAGFNGGLEKQQSGERDRGDLAVSIYSWL